MIDPRRLSIPGDEELRVGAEVGGEIDFADGQAGRRSWSS